MIVIYGSDNGCNCWESNRKVAASTCLGSGATSRSDQKRLQWVVELQKAMYCVKITSEVSSEVGTDNAMMAGFPVLFEIKKHRRQIIYPQLKIY